MIKYLITPNFIVLSTILIAVLNLLTPFISKKDSGIRNFLLIIVSVFFFINILVIDGLFLKGIRTSISLFAFGNYSVAFHLETLGLIFLNLLGVLWICSLMYTTKYLKLHNIGHSSRFLFFMNLSVLSGVFISLAANLFTMFLFYEILTLSTAPLIGHNGGDKERKGLYRYLKILMVSSIVLFLPAILIIYAKIGHGNFIYQGFIQDSFSKNQTIILLVMFVFGISKAALYPLHQWLPAAMIAAYPVSALLHAVVVVKAGLFCIYKILVCVFGLKYLQAIFVDINWPILLPIFTIFYSSIKALRADNIKTILAYSTINQLSIALLSAFMFTPKAIAAAVLHMVSHSFSKICLFYAAGIYYSLKSTAKISDLIGISREKPKTSFIFLIASLSLIGLPPFGGFISKFYIMLAAAEQDNILVMIVVASSSVLTALYIVKILIFIYRPDALTRLSIAPLYDRQAVKNNKLFSKPSLNREALEEQGQTATARLLSARRFENKMPLLMLISLSICLSGVIFFFLVHRFINMFLVYIG
jgi:multicomponent Na+:H+ antiporter subunit D